MSTLRGMEGKGSLQNERLKLTCKKHIHIEHMMRGPHFPIKFTNWIMACLGTVSNSIAINGKTSISFIVK